MEYKHCYVPLPLPTRDTHIIRVVEGRIKEVNASPSNIKIDPSFSVVKLTGRVNQS